MTSRIPADYVERVYAGWLGKVIGVRFGAPVEMWTAEKIAAFYGELTTYVKHFEEFAADDDTNGPLFFIRALEDFACDETLTAEQIGDTLLNYAPFEHGFFWWGGYGVSTEHTVYTNLRAGIKAPRSGSYAQNGRIIPEQIGGQIFIDSWGLVNPCDYRRAARFARKAASVLCDGEGVYGGMYMAACISAAFEDGDCQSVMNKALSVIPQDCAYARVVRDVMRFYAANPKDFRACLSYIKQNYWMDKYIGNCHIIPNAAIVALAMCYGENDFDKTLCVGNMCGFDTDCNVGNLGAIMGVMRGLDGISGHWLPEIHDFQACSSVAGCLNITDVASSALYLARLGLSIAGEEAPEKWREYVQETRRRLHFEFPRSTQAARAYRADDTPCSISLINTDEDAHEGARCLRISADQWTPGGMLRVCTRTYYEKADFANGRYEPVFSPIAYPGQTARAFVKPACAGAVRARLYALDAHDGQAAYGEACALAAGEWTALEMTIPSGDMCVREVGVEFIAQDAAGGYMSVYLDDLSWEGAADYAIRWQKEKNWAWHARDTRMELSQFTRLKGVWHVTDNGVEGHCADFGEAYTGDIAWGDYALETTLTPLIGAWHAVNLRVQGAARAYAAALCEGGVALYKNSNGVYERLAFAPCAWRLNESVDLRCEAVGARLRVAVNGAWLIDYTDESAPYARGMIGLNVRAGSACRYGDITLKSIKEA